MAVVDASWLLRTCPAVPWQHRLRISGISGTPDTRFQAKTACLQRLQWARLDSNQGPTDYESAALTS
jgi:hypothetical protein